MKNDHATVQHINKICPLMMLLLFPTSLQGISGSPQMNQTFVCGNIGIFSFSGAATATQRPTDHWFQDKHIQRTKCH